ncbi:endonuclease/exonuclease/phosphatase family metal-dependent hydrolase [Thermocatellispora tengchongensis]|uniref:Endonuclease/exonuclease/phosphatase family metal-dependent hydrolase n=1 Tax=Thermocatellispora tengchongensis TaxID=1073253 RepID=A0A840NZD3_9ACTN|nr:endonuclease/exonuclease/phosphatase family protein [Thermocatellispora tengchongensis]MBB5132848.1 endonuclease/exonuclease/phosphatase family metal-dependent hydrolase [Thermocatellispora tengchongensis]
MAVEEAVTQRAARPAGHRGWWPLDLALWTAASLFALWAALRLSGWEALFRWVQLVSFTPYVAAVAPLPALAALLLRRWGAGAVAAVAALALAAAVLPRALPEDAPAGGPRTLRVLSANLLEGRAGQRALVDLVRAEHADVLTLQEATPDAADRLEAAGLLDLLPHRAGGLIRGGTRGSAIYARFPVRELPPIDIGGFGQARAMIAVPGGAEVEVTSAHPCAPYREALHACWRDGLRALPGAGGEGTLRVLAGDFNSTLDHAELRAVIARGYRDAADAVGEGLRATWPYDGRPVPGVALDRVLADERMAVTAFRVHELPRTDHRAVFAELRLP